jgi:hypothetical protein
MTLPTWFLRRLAAPGGVRLAKLPTMDKVAGTCPVCSKAVIEEMRNGSWNLRGIWERGSYYHFLCIPAHARVDDKTRIQVPKGNLDQEEYRFWIGQNHPWPNSLTNFAMCRACKTSIYGDRLRKDHFKNDRYYIAGEPCSTRIVNVLKTLLLQPSCIICKRQRFGRKKWGVPLCEDPQCEMAWKFGQDRHIPFEFELKKQEKRLLERAAGATSPIIYKPDEYMDQAGGKIIPIKVLGPATRPWCAHCGMFADASGHDEIHAAGVIAGDIEED